MADKKRILKLQDLDFIGTQETISPVSRKRVEQLTGKLFHLARTKTSTTISKAKKLS